MELSHVDLAPLALSPGRRGQARANLPGEIRIVPDGVCLRVDVAEPLEFFEGNTRIQCSELVRILRRIAGEEYFPRIAGTTTEGANVPHHVRGAVSGQPSRLPLSRPV